MEREKEGKALSAKKEGLQGSRRESHRQRSLANNLAGDGGPMNRGGENKTIGAGRQVRSLGGGRVVGEERLIKWNK